MPNTYASKLIDLLNRTGQPTTTTTTSKGTGTVTTPGEGFDISSLISMLMMMSLFKQPNTQASPQSALNLLSQQNLPSPRLSTGLGALPNSTVGTPTGGTGLDVSQLLRLLANIKT